MKKALFFLFLLLTGSTIALSEKVTVKAGGIVYNVDIVTGTASVGQNYDKESSADYNKYTGKLSGDIVLVSDIRYQKKRYPVTSIDCDAFRGCDNVVSIVLSDSIRMVDCKALSNLSGLKKITVSAGNPYFQAPDGILFTKDMTKICCFPAGRNDTKYYVPSSVVSIERGAFANCKSLREVLLPDNLEYISEGAFMFSGIDTIKLPESITVIDKDAFYYCTNLRSITFPEKLSKVGSQAFYYCYNLKSIICHNKDLNFTTDVLSEKQIKEIVYEIPAGVLTESAQSGDPKYQFLLAEKFRNGNGLQKNLKTAIEWYKKSAGKGYMSSQITLGNIYLKGEGTEKNLTEAIKWFSMAAENGNVYAQNFLGDCYFDAIEVKQDLKTAFNYYKSAAEQGDTVSIKKVAYCYYNGKGVDRNYSEAGKWYMKSATMGDNESAYYVALMLYEEKGLEKNDAEALKWAEKAVNGGLEESKWLYFELAYKDAVNDMDGGYYNLAISRFTSLLGYDKENVDALIDRGYCYLQLKPKKYTDAEADFKKALELDKNNNTAQGNMQVVLDHYKKEEDIKALCNEGDSYFIAKDYVNAVTSYAKAVYIDNTNPVPYTNIGLCYYACQQYADALGFFDKALEFDPDFKDAITGRELAKTSMVNQAVSNALNSFSNSLNDAYNSSSNYSNYSNYNNQQDNNSYLDDMANKAVYREQQNSRDKYNMYMKLYEQEQAESDSYFKRYQISGDLDDLRRSKEDQSRANDYLQKANIWK
ncbi:MAG TPA: leucine-rich repeat protein [Bacteroidales bacterium]|nr:leucine-rich repeat protein [Bacteroidales bacterium]HPT20656.1 leucine-rich repeat protein [Bacteroidales bacterium]